MRAYLYWSQVEPEPGHYRWETVDALLGQVRGDEELWITVCSSSRWGTRQPTDFLPPSPARDQRAYSEFVCQLVRRCAGRVRYWQCDNEPSNTDLLWAGTAAEYVEQLQTMYRAVKQADPAAAVVLGGCGYDVLSSAEGSAPRQFFAHVADAGRINCRQVVMRTLLALAGGVRRTAYWNLAPEYPGPVDHHQMMHLMIGKLPLLGYQDGELSVRQPAADSFALLAERLAGARTVSRVTTGDRPGLYAFEIDRAGRGPLLVLWDHRDPFDGEDEPPVTTTWPWPADAAIVTDVFGRTWTARRQDGQIRLPVSVTPLFVAAPDRSRAGRRPIDPAPARRLNKKEQVFLTGAIAPRGRRPAGPCKGASCIRRSCSCTWSRKATRTGRTSAAARPAPDAIEPAPSPGYRSRP